LIAILENLKIDYTEDKIPYGGIQQPVYRIFVMGCAILKVEHLKKDYFDIL